MGERARENDHRRVQEVDVGREALTDQTSGMREQLGAKRITELRAVTDVTGCDFPPTSGQFSEISASPVSRCRNCLARNGAAAGNHVQAPFGAAMTDDVPAFARRRMADETRMALRAGMQLSVGHDA